MGAFSPKYGKWQHCPVNDLYADGAEQSRSHGWVFDESTSKFGVKRTPYRAEATV